MSPHRNDCISPPDSDYEMDSTQITKENSRLMHRSFKVDPAVVESASGIELHLADGRTIIDACGGAAVAILGHGNQEVVAAMTEQAQKVCYIHTQSYITPSAEQLAHILLQDNPHGLEKAFFVSSGSEAVESALKLARQYYFELGETQRMHIVSRKQGYHGNTMGCMSISQNLPRKIPFRDFGYSQVSAVTPAYSYRYKHDDESEHQFAQRLIQELEDEFLRLGPDTVLAFVAETVVGATLGCVGPPPGYLQGVREVCDRYGVLLILDEIMCGTGRCGTFFAFEQEGPNIAPDIVAIAKGLGAGYSAIAGILANKKVVDVIRQGTSAFNHGHTYQAHPVACATALAVQKILRRDRLIERCAKMGRVLETKLRTELSHCRSVGDIRGRGLFWGIEFVQDRTTKATFDPKTFFGPRVQQAAFELGVALYPGVATADGERGDHIIISPPFTVTDEQLNKIVSVVRQAIESQEALFIQ